MAASDSAESARVVWRVEALGGRHFRLHASLAANAGGEQSLGWGAGRPGTEWRVLTGEGKALRSRVGHPFAKKKPRGSPPQISPGTDKVVQNDVDLNDSFRWADDQGIHAVAYADSEHVSEEPLPPAIKSASKTS
jgi:hypothetical protein